MHVVDCGKDGVAKRRETETAIQPGLMVDFVHSPPGVTFIAVGFYDRVADLNLYSLRDNTDILPLSHCGRH